MKRFNSKILLFGEYTVLDGTKAIAQPFDVYGGEIHFNANYKSDKLIYESNKVFTSLLVHLNKESFHATFNHNNYSNDLNKGVYFKSNIPIGYGLGSSGAVAASVYYTYFNDKPTILDKLKQDLAAIESFFHGNSSGTDPLVSYTNKALQLNPNKVIEDVTMNTNVKCFLIDSKKARQTSQLINTYAENIKQNPALSEELCKQTNITIDAYLNNTSNLYSEIQHLCILQHHLLDDLFVFPKALINYKKVFGEMLSIKLCGAGGGGFLLGFTHSNYYEEVVSRLKSINVKLIPIPV